MANLENQYVEVRISVSPDDQEALEANKLTAKDVAARIAVATVMYCEAKQTACLDIDGECGVGSFTFENKNGLQVGFFCEKPICQDQSICSSYAAPLLLAKINSQK